MEKSFKRTFWNIIPEVAIIFASIQIANFLPIPKSPWSLAGLFILIFIALGAKYWWGD